MPGPKKKSIFLRKPKKIKKHKPERAHKPKPGRVPGNAIKQGINEASSLSIAIQRLLDTTFANAPPVLRKYLHRMDREAKDLIKVLTSKLGGTPDPEQIHVTASALLEELADTDPVLSSKLAKILKRGK
jgi:hypothetical protein